MVCDTQRPCSRCVKRGIDHLCTDQPPPKRPSQQRTTSSTHSCSSHSPQSVSPPMVGGDVSSGGGGGGGVLTSPTARVSGISLDPISGLRSITTPEDQVINRSIGGVSGGSSIYDTSPNSIPPSHPAWPLLPTNATASHGQEEEMKWGWRGDGVAPVGVPSGSGVSSGGGGAVGVGGGVGGFAMEANSLGGQSTNDLIGQGYGYNDLGMGMGLGSDGLQQGEFAPLSGLLESLGIPSLPGGLGDIWGMGAPRPEDEIGRDDGLTGIVGLGGWSARNNMGTGDETSPKEAWEKRGERAAEGASKMIPDQVLMNRVSKTERYLLAAADQANGTRDERLAQVIRAKYEAGLLKPYDYSRGYARMIKWMEKNVTPQTKQAILRPLSGFRPAFRAIAQTLSDIDLVFVEEAFERLMLDYDRVFSAIHTPACLWRRTGEIYKANREFSTLTGIPAALLRGGKLAIYQLMTEESTVRYFENLASIAFDAAHKSVNTVCTLRIPTSLTRSLTTTTPSMNPLNPISTGPTPRSSPNLIAQHQSLPSFTPIRSPLQGSETALPTMSGFGQSMSASASGQGQGQIVPVEYRIVKCCFSFTIRRDSWGIPIALIGNWIPM